MKRTLAEVSAGVAVLIALLCFHRQLHRVEVRQAGIERRQEGVELRQGDIGALERAIHQTIARGDATRDELRSNQEQVIAQTEARLCSLEQQLLLAAAGSEQAETIACELEQAQRDAAQLQRRLSSDFAETKALVDSYMKELRAKHEDCAARLRESRQQIAAIAGSVYRDRGAMTRQMLLPTVQLNSDDTVGSGTIVFSGPNPRRSQRVESYVLTSYHVVRNILADTPRTAHEGFDVTVYLDGEQLLLKGRMVASEPGIDAALVKLETDLVLPHVANALPRSQSDEIQVWDPICAVGCPLGNDPVPSTGEVSSLHNDLNGSNYWLVNAPTYFGNSGGGIYRYGTRQLIGVFSKIYTHGQSHPVVVPHLGLCTPIDLVYDWLEEHDLDHLISSARVEQVDLQQLAAPAK